jgi:hypothetical protein
MATCLHSGQNGSCPRLAATGSLFCDRHTDEQMMVRDFLIEDADLRAKFETHKASDLYSLQNEVALLRTMIYDRLNMAKSEAERIVAYREIGTWMGTIDKLVNSLNKLEKETSQVLTKEAVLAIGRAMVQVIADEIKALPDHEQVIDAIAVRIVPLIENATNR